MVAVSTSVLNYHGVRNICAKFHAFITICTIVTYFWANSPHYKSKSTFLHFNTLIKISIPANTGKLNDVNNVIFPFFLTFPNNSFKQKKYKMFLSNRCLIINSESYLLLPSFCPPPALIYLSGHI